MSRIRFVVLVILIMGSFPAYGLNVGTCVFVILQKLSYRFAPKADLEKEIASVEGATTKLVSDFQDTDQKFDNKYFLALKNLGRNYAQLRRLYSIAYRRSIIPYRCVPLKNTYLGESHVEEDMEASLVYYIPPENRDDYRVRVAGDGKLYRGNANHPLDTEGNELFVMSVYGDIYIGKGYYEGVDYSLHHSSFLMGQPVASAGILKVDDGKIIFINNGSGHYRPSQEHNEQLIHKLRNSGYDTRGLVVLKQ